MNIATFDSKRILLGLLAATGCMSCTSPSFPPGTLTLLTGQEASAWTVDPKASSVQVSLLEAGTRNSLAEFTLPQLSQPDSQAPIISLGHGGPEGVQVNFEATAFDAEQNPVMHGVGSTFTLRGFDAASLYVFLGRSGFARPFGALFSEHRHPLLTVWPNGYLFVNGSDTTGTDGAAFDVYNIARGSLLDDGPGFPLAAKSSASSHSQLLLVGDNATLWYDPVLATSTVAAAPPGLVFSEVIGGKTLLAADGTQYLVGAARSSGDPSDKVLRVDRDGTLHTLRLGTPRLGAAVAFVAGNLLIVGGADTGAGAEVLAAGATDFASLDLPADATQGAALAELTPSVALLIFGTDSAGAKLSTLRTLDLECTNDCTTTELGSLESSLDRVQAFTLVNQRVLVVGDAEDGETHALSLDLSSDTPIATEQSFRERRAGASAVLLPNGQVAVVAGDKPGSANPVSSIELFFP